MKKIIIVFLLSLSLIGFTGCDTNDQTGDDNTTVNDNPTDDDTSNNSITFKTLNVSYKPRLFGGSSTWGSTRVKTARILDNPGTVSISTGKYGGRRDMQETPTGFFYTKKVEGRWWFVDPDGYLMINTALNSVKTTSDFNATDCVSAMQDMAFNGTGAWSSNDDLNALNNKMPWVKVLYSMYDFAKEFYNGNLGPNNMSFEGGIIPILDPRFENYAKEKVIKQIKSNWINDPYLIGYYMDNELPWKEDALDRFLKLGADDPNYKNTQTWLNTNGGNVNDTTRKRFLTYITETYFSIVSTAIKSVDPNHLFLGSRLHANTKYNEQVVRSAGKYVDVVSINLYSRWEPVDSDMDKWLTWAEKPFLISEFYIKSSDTGKDNTDGAGDLVKTQQDRGYWYQNFTLKLLQHSGCIGWQWHRFADQKSGNEGSNKGFYTFDRQPYSELTNRAEIINTNLYPIIDFFDAKMEH